MARRSSLSGHLPLASHHSRRNTAYGMKPPKQSTVERQGKLEGILSTQAHCQYLLTHR